MHAGSGRAWAALLALGLASTVAGCTWSSGSTSGGGTAHGAPDAEQVVDYTVDIPDDADGLLAEADACYERHAALVDMLWQTGGTEVRDFDRRRDEALTPAMRECLSSHDVRWSESDSMDELLAKAIELLESTQADCIEETGYATWQG